MISETASSWYDNDLNDNSDNIPILTNEMMMIHWKNDVIWRYKLLMIDSMILSRETIIIVVMIFFDMYGMCDVVMWRIISRRIIDVMW